ncbi:unnamed protein product [Phytophthora lilii]|uniref:Unnamed protein product n=1 Tax=Phytophthora lilii TaxID=2077276 RepID=A0A9W6YID3_9STRA|nr:unnamed protein product [Phytophthora lilii]
MSDTRGCLIECSGAFEGYITAAALKKVFPNALEDEALADQVLHRRFICPTRTLISIDTNGRWIQYDAEADVFKAMSELVDFNLFQAAKIMENATIQEGSLLPSIDSSIEVKGFGDDVYDGDVQNPTTSKSSIEFILS